MWVGFCKFSWKLLRTLINSNSVRDTSREVFTPFCSASYAVQWNWVRVRVCLSLWLIITPTDSDCCYRRAATCLILSTSRSFEVVSLFWQKFVNKYNKITDFQNWMLPVLNATLWLWQRDTNPILQPKAFDGSVRKTIWAFKLCRKLKTLF